MSYDCPIELGLATLRHNESLACGAFARLEDSDILKRVFPGRVDGQEFKRVVDSLAKSQAEDLLHILGYGCAAIRLGNAYGGSLATAIGEGT